MVENFISSNNSSTIVVIAQTLQRYLIEQHSLLQDIRALLVNQRPECTLVDVCQLILQNMDLESSLIRVNRDFFESHRLLYQAQTTAATFGPYQENDQLGLGRPILPWLQQQHMHQYMPPEKLHAHLQWLQQQKVLTLPDQISLWQSGQLDQQQELQSQWQEQHLSKLKQQKRQLLDQLELNHENLKLPASPQNSDQLNEQSCACLLSSSSTITVNID